ncbi:hypothetical protein DMC63_40195 [Streptomyces sp. WAC 05977]|nr:hypothetical protein DMC63_40195 [Streptomyces sp. WAC 05977]
MDGAAVTRESARSLSFSRSDAVACYVFYGGDIRQQAVGWLLGQLGSIARLPASNPDNDLVRGLFFASHEADGMSEWRIHQGQVLISSGDKRYRYLDD